LGGPFRLNPSAAKALPIANEASKTAAPPTSVNFLNMFVSSGFSRRHMPAATDYALQAPDMQLQFFLFG
jgi:hypothetical protein